MNATLVTALLRQRLMSPMRMVLAFTFFCFPLLMAAAMPAVGVKLMGAAFAMVMSAGLIGQDVSSGVIAGILARPVRRSEYVLSRWAAGAAGAALLVVLQAMFGAAILILRGAQPDLGAIAASAGGGMLEVAGVSAVLLFFSACVNGLGDLGIYLLGFLVSQMAKGAGALKAWAWLERTGAELERFLAAKIEPAQLWGAGFSAFDVASYLSTVAVCLALAVIIVNRKELTYAAG